MSGQNEYQELLASLSEFLGKVKYTVADLSTRVSNVAQREINVTASEENMRAKEEALVVREAAVAEIEYTTNFIAENHALRQELEDERNAFESEKKEFKKNSSTERLELIEKNKALDNAWVEFFNSKAKTEEEVTARVQKIVDNLKK